MSDSLKALRVLVLLPLDILGWIVSVGVLCLALIAFLPLLGSANYIVSPIALGVVIFCGLLTLLRKLAFKSGSPTYLWVSVVALLISLTRLVLGGASGF